MDPQLISALGSAPSDLETLPLLVLESICQYLGHCDSKRRSLFAFSLVSKRCCSIVAAQRFERIKLNVRGRLELQQDLERWSGILSVEGRLRHVRRIKVVGYMPRYGLGKGYKDPQINVALALAEKRRDGLEDEGYEDDFVDPPAQHILFSSTMSPPEDEAAKRLHDEAWQPLAKFISALPVLRDFVYSCLDQVAPCLLATLHQHHPDSRLHVHTLRLRSLYQMNDDLHDIDPDEFALVTSPCLYAIASASSNGYDTDGHVDYHEEALFAMASGVSPNLRHVRVWHSYPGNSIALLQAVRTPRPPWQGFYIDKGKPHYSCGRLDSLVLDGEDNVSPRTLEKWDNYVDLSKLCSLEMRQGVKPDALQVLVLMAETGKLNGLSRLSLKPVSWSPEEHPQLDAAMGELLKHLRSLAELEITGYHGPTGFSVILKHHGRSLHKLGLVNSEDHQGMMSSLPSIEAILEYCPNLRDLSLRIPRTKGDKRELAIYHTLGRLLYLRRLALVLECSGQRWDELNLNLPPTDLVRDIFINAAVDESLARSIFHAITGTAESPVASSPLESLSVSVDKSAYVLVWNDYDFYSIISWIGRSWLCRKFPRDDNAGGTTVAVDEKQKQQRELYSNEFIDEDWNMSFGHGLVYEKVWKEIWPERTGNWMNDWQSFPLMEERCVEKE